MIGDLCFLRERCQNENTECWRNFDQCIIYFFYYQRRDGTVFGTPVLRLSVVCGSSLLLYLCLQYYYLSFVAPVCCCTCRSWLQYLSSCPMAPASPVVCCVSSTCRSFMAPVSSAVCGSSISFVVHGSSLQWYLL